MGNKHTCKISVEGTQIPDAYKLIHAIIRMEVNRIGKAVLQFEAGANEIAPFEFSDSDILQPAKTIKVEVISDEKTDALFEGIILSCQLDSKKGNSAVFTVECRDYAYLTTLGRRNAIYEDISDDMIIKKILSSYGNISAKVEGGDIEHQSITQYYVTDWDFILSRADVNGMIICTSGKEIKICPPDVDSGTVASVSYQNDILDFKGTISGTEQYSEINTAAWSYTNQALTEMQAAPAKYNEQGDLSLKDLSSFNSNRLLYQTNAAVDDESLRKWADSLAFRAALKRYGGYFVINGNASVIPGSLVELKGMGKRFDGKIFAGYVEHVIDMNDWKTEVGMGLPDNYITEQPDVAAPLAAGYLPGIQGMHIGKVTQIHEDPGKESRIQIALPLLNGDNNLIWARLALTYAGNKTGIFFVPEVDDEVVVGFFNNDPCCPVVLGSLYSSKIPAPNPLTEKNEIKAIVTKEKLTIEFNDEKKIISIRTPGNNMIEINDDGKSVTINDQNKNSFIMDTNGVTIQSDKDIILKAKGNITVEANSKLGMKSSTSDVSIEGTNVKAQAKIEISLKGNAKAELNASGQTIVKGAMVMIN